MNAETLELPIRDTRIAGLSVKQGTSGSSATIARACASSLTSSFSSAPLRPWSRAAKIRSEPCRLESMASTDQDSTGTNFLDVTVRVVRGRVLVLAAEDNLVRGASGVAVQNLNRMIGLDERTGLL